MRKTNKKAAPLQGTTASATNGSNITTASVPAASARKPLTPAQLGRFSVSVGELIERAQKEGRAER